MTRGTITTIRKGAITGHALNELREATADLMPDLEWRHSGLGMLQAYVAEGGTDEARIHVWDNRLRKPKIEDAGLLHDHRFDMTSTILLGILRQQEIEFAPYPERHDPFADPYQMIEIRSNYRKSKNTAELVTLPDVYTAWFTNHDLEAGDEYDFPRGAFHGTYTPIDVEKWGPTITIIHKYNQQEVNARILAPVGVPVVHAFDTSMPEAEWRPILENAIQKLKEAA